MKPRTLLRLALAGTHADALRVTLTALSAALATFTVLAGLTVLAIEGGAPGYYGPVSQLHYTNALLREPGLRPGVAFTLFVLTIPVLGLAAQCARLGAPERDRRLAALRLAGTTPGQAVLVAVAETGIAALLGALGALGAYFAGRPLAHHRDAAGNLPLPTDVLPPVWEIIVTTAAVPLLAAGLAALVLRRVTISPFGVVRRERRKTPSAAMGFLILVGGGIFVSASILLHRPGAGRTTSQVEALLFGSGVGAAVALLGLILGTGWVTATVGRLVHRGARRPSTLLAGSRLAADPWSTARSYAALLLCVAVGAGIAAVDASFHGQQELEARAGAIRARILGEAAGPAEVDPFYDRAFQLIYYAVLAGVVVATAALLVSIVESIVTRRRSYSTLVASGVPRGVLARATVWQTIGPLLVAVPAAAALGAGLPLTLVGAPSSPAYDTSICTPPVDRPDACGDPATQGLYEHRAHIPALHAGLAIPWRELLFLVGGALGIALLVTAVALLVLGPGTRPSELRTT